MNTKPDLERVVLAAREEWQHDPQLRAEFDHDIDVFIAWKKADAMGIGKVYGGRTVSAKEQGE